MSRRVLARAIMDQAPGIGGGHADAVYDIRVVALLILLEDCEDVPGAVGRDRNGLPVNVIRDELGVSQATASAIVEMARREWLVEDVKTFDHRLTAVALTAKGKQARRRRRGNKPT